MTSSPVPHVLGSNPNVFNAWFTLLFLAGCTKANLSSTVATYAAEFAREETAHVAFLYDVLTQAGTSPVCPFLNIGKQYNMYTQSVLHPYLQIPDNLQYSLYIAGSQQACGACIQGCLGNRPMVMTDQTEGVAPVIRDSDLYTNSLTCKFLIDLSPLSIKTTLLYTLNEFLF